MLIRKQISWAQIQVSIAASVNTARFLKYVWPFHNIMHERVKIQHFLKLPGLPNFTNCFILKMTSVLAVVDTFICVQEALELKKDLKIPLKGLEKNKKNYPERNWDQSQNSKDILLRLGRKLHFHSLTFLCNHLCISGLIFILLRLRNHLCISGLVFMFSLRLHVIRKPLRTFFSSSDLIKEMPNFVKKMLMWKAWIFDFHVFSKSHMK